jgi:tetratricopeptide (TPR) repeat protein
MARNSTRQEHKTASVEPAGLGHDVTPEPVRLWLAFSQDDPKAPAIRFLERGEELLKVRSDQPNWQAAQREAIAAFDQAAALDHELVDPYALRATALFHLGTAPQPDQRKRVQKLHERQTLSDLTAAVTECDSALGFEEKLIERAESLLSEANSSALKNDDEYQGTLEHAREAFDYVAWLHLLRALVLSALDTRHDEAIAECDKALGLRRRGDHSDRMFDVSIYRSKARLLRRVDRHDEALLSGIEALRIARDATWNDPIAASTVLSGIAGELSESAVAKKLAERYDIEMRRKARDLNALADGLGYTSFEQAKRVLERGAPNTAGGEPAPAMAKSRHGTATDIEAMLVAAETEAIARVDGSLLRALRRHRNERKRLSLPENGYTNSEDALAAARLANNFSNLQKRLRAAGMEPLPPDDRVRAAQRLSKAFFRVDHS